MTGRPVPEAYADALKMPRLTCGAEPGEYCLVDDDRHGPRLLRVPCVRRCPPGTAPEPRLAHPSRSFSEPLRGPRDDDEATA